MKFFILRSEKELTWRCIPFEFFCPWIAEGKINTFINIIAIFLSVFLFYGILILLLGLMFKGTELLFNRFVYGTWTAPQPILPMFWPAPAA